MSTELEHISFFLAEFSVEGCGEKIQKSFLTNVLAISIFVMVTFCLGHFGKTLICLIFDNFCNFPPRNFFFLSYFGRGAKPSETNLY